MCLSGLGGFGLDLGSDVLEQGFLDAVIRELTFLTAAEGTALSSSMIPARLLSQFSGMVVRLVIANPLSVFVYAMRALRSLLKPPFYGLHPSDSHFDSLGDRRRLAA